jgi:RNA polymerase sigma-70 factor (ECF subfamily)
MRTTLDTKSLSDEELAALAAREGSDGPAFVELVSRFQERVWRVCYRVMGNAEEAQDAAQEVFVRLFLHRAKFAGRSKYSTWVHGIAVRTCLMIRRSRGRRSKRENTAGEAALARHERRDVQQQGEDTLDLAQMLETLDEDERALLLLKYAEGHSYEELAEMFELSVSACKMRISRARTKLKERFPEHDFGGDESE